jgi:DNA ligase 1
VKKIDDNATILPFQVLSSRSRVSQKREREEANIMIVIFDIILLNGVSLIDFPLYVRRQKISQTFSEVFGKIQFAQHKDFLVDSDEVDVKDSIQAFFMSSIKNCEGVILKFLDSQYKAAERSNYWLKIKKDYIEGHEESLDLVPIGGWYGNGRKAGWISPILMCAYDSESGNFFSVCKVMSGFSDEHYKQLSEYYLDKSNQLEELPSYYQISADMIPPVLFFPNEVWEIRGAEFSESPVHTAGVGFLPHEKGISVRFPRFICQRSDKSVHEATSVKELVHLYNLSRAPRV